MMFVLLQKWAAVNKCADKDTDIAKCAAEAEKYINMLVSKQQNEIIF